MKVLLVDDHKILLQGIKSMLESAPNVESIEIFSDSRNVLPYLNSHKVDLIITDLNMPGISGIELIKKIKVSLPAVKIGVLTMYYNAYLLETLKELNVDAYLLKNMDESAFFEALNAVQNGEKYFSQDIKTVNTNYDYSFSHDDKIIDVFMKKYYLSPREFEILHLIVQDLNSKEIAEKLFISKETVSTHRKSIIKKTGCNSIIELYQLAIEMGLIYNSK